MKAQEIKARFEEELEKAKASLSEFKVDISANVEVEENELDNVIKEDIMGEDDAGDAPAREVEELVVFAALGLTAEGLTEEDVYYTSMSISLTDGEGAEEDVENAIAEFRASVEHAKEILSTNEDAKEAILALDREVDEKLHKEYLAQVEKTQKAVHRDLKIAVIAAAALTVIAIAIAVLTRVL